MSTRGKSLGTLTEAMFHLMRLYLGAWMVINGLNHWIPIFPQPFGGSDQSQLFITTLVDTGLFGIAKAVEVIGGLLLIFNLFTPFSLVLLLPVSAMVYFNATVLQGRWLRIIGENGLYMGTVCLYLNVILLFCYIRYYVPMLNIWSSLGSWRDLGLLGSIFGTGTDSESPTKSSMLATASPPARVGGAAWWASAGVGLLLCLVVTWQLRPLAEFSASSGKTGREVVADYLAMAYDQGRGADAADMYFTADVADFAANAIDRRNGRPIEHEVLSLIADGMTVAVHHRIAPAAGEPAMEVVDIFKVDRFSQIQERRRITMRLEPSP